MGLDIICWNRFGLRIDRLSSHLGLYLVRPANQSQKESRMTICTFQASEIKERFDPA